MGRIPRESIDNILDRLDIVEIISGYLQLKRAGRNFKACCPFHNEKTPSFVVSPDKQIYHCFGCQVGGNVIDFIMRYDGLEFPEAVKVLAGKAGVELPLDKNEQSSDGGLYSSLCEANKVAADFYVKVLAGPRGNKAMDYLNSRGLKSETITFFGIGYAPSEWESLYRYCTGKKISADILRKAGLTIPSDKSKRDYDRFRDRIIFPIHNERGVLVAFGGRVMDDRLPKYINSPETRIYSKSNVLYGLNYSKRGIRESGFAMLVEGYMDVIATFQNGIKNVVATSGTALTTRQVEILKKFTDTAIMVFDSDKAGEGASLRGLDILVENGMKVRVVTLPEGDDPDSFVSREGTKAFLEFVQKADDLFDYKLALMVQKKGKRDIGGIVDEMLPTIAKIESAVIQSDRLSKLAEKLGLHEASLRVEMGKISKAKEYKYETSIDLKQTLSLKTRNSEIHILGLCISDRKRCDMIAGEIGCEVLADDSIRRAMEELQSLFERSSDDQINPGKLLGRLQDNDNARQVVVQAMAMTENIADPDKAFRDCVLCLRKENKQARLEALNKKLRSAQENGDLTVMTETLKLIDKVHKEKVA